MRETLKTIEQAEAYLLCYSPAKMSGESYALGRMQALMSHLGNPQERLRVIHVAGTSGKTSTAYYIRALLQESGARTGLTASPHIVDITERVQVNGEPLSGSVFLKYLNEFLGLLEQWPDIQPTYFELCVAMAYWVFDREQVDYAVIETGLGGLLDATNVVKRTDKLCVITPIGLDHTRVLGSTLEAIAGQKAGIIQSQNHVFIAEQPKQVNQVFTDVASLRQAHIHAATKQQLAVNHLPPFQQRNFGLAYETVEYIRQRDGLERLKDRAIHRASNHTAPGRYEKYQIDGKLVILDGAHNPQKLSGLIEALRAEAKQDMTWVVAFVEAPDAKIRECTSIVSEMKPRMVIATDFQVGQDTKGRQSISASSLASIFQKHSQVAVSQTGAVDAFEQALNEPSATVVVTGSLYLVSALRPYILKRSE